MGPEGGFGDGEGAVFIVQMSSEYVGAVLVQSRGCGRFQGLFCCELHRFFYPWYRSQNFELNTLKGRRLYGEGHKLGTVGGSDSLPLRGTVFIY